MKQKEQEKEKVCRPHVLLNLWMDYPRNDLASQHARLLSAIKALGWVTYEEAAFKIGIVDLDWRIKELAAQGYDIGYVKGRYVLKARRSGEVSA